jgi:hypothetical protein
MTTDGWRLLALALALQAGLAGVSAAEQAGAASGAAPSAPVYLQIGPVVTVHTEGEQYHRASPPLKGTTVGGALTAGVRLVPELAFEAEVLFDGKLSAPIVDSYSTRTDYTAESRDIVLGANLRFRPRGGSHLEFTAGGGVAFSRFARRDIVVTSFFPPGVITRQRDQETSTTNPTASGSMAISIPLSPRVELVPSIGARWIRREFDTDAWYFGVGRYTVFFSAALRVRP